jgi:hypothetical protein
MNKEQIAFELLREVFPKQFQFTIGIIMNSGSSSLQDNERTRSFRIRANSTESRQIGEISGVIKFLEKWFIKLLENTISEYVEDPKNITYHQHRNIAIIFKNMGFTEQNNAWYVSVYKDEENSYVEFLQFLSSFKENFIQELMNIQWNKPVKSFKDFSKDDDIKL